MPHTGRAVRASDPEFGARPLRRTIQRLVETELSRMVLSGALDPGSRVRVGADGDELTFDVDEQDVAEEEKEQVRAEATS